MNMYVCVREENEDSVEMFLCWKVSTVSKSSSKYQMMSSIAI